jgi:MFS family permease
VATNLVILNVRSTLCFLNTTHIDPDASDLPALYAVALFMPTIINSLGFTAASAQLLSIPPFACAALWAIVAGWLSDRTGYRGPFVAFNILLQIIGYSLAYGSNGGAAMGYTACFVSATGAYSNLSMINAWIAGNSAGEVKRGTVVAMSIGIGNLGGCV